MSLNAVPFLAMARLAAGDDNVAIAIQRIEAGSRLVLDSTTLFLPHTVLEGHRFAVRTVAVGQMLLSWGLPFGRAIRDLRPGDYVCNASMLEALKVRTLEGLFPEQANFEDHIETFELNETTFRPGAPVEPIPSPRTFSGFARTPARGVGTRNMIVVLGTSSRTSALARQIVDRLQGMLKLFPAVDGVVAIAHTEGGGPETPNNLTEVLRALSGFMVHPNVGAILAIDQGTEPVNNRLLERFLRDQGYPIDDVRHAFMSARGSVTAILGQAEATIKAWLPEVQAARRSEQPLSMLRVALQCGGSDAFSGVSGNPLAGSVIHELIRHGGSGNLCETDELVGAESYVLKNVRDAGTARQLLETIASFKERLSWHGITPESNPSAGNKLRGLYNIVLKSLGAAHKKDPRTRIEKVIAYGQRMRDPGFHFMDSPGNDLEGIAGQVASGCNLFLFVTGNGSITNFPFVPTLKITTTTRRHELLIHEMDVNAGRYLDGESMEALTQETFDLVVATASGKQTKGEMAGHSQMSLWRNWRQTDASQLPEILRRTTPDGTPLATRVEASARLLHRSDAEFPAFTLHRTHSASAIERIGLVLPTSLCATQIARLAAERLNASGLAGRYGLSRFATLLHTEGCGFGGESMHRLLHRTYRGYAQHPNIAATLLLEHGCEKVPNDVMKRQFEAAGVDLDRFGWASVQLDGGIEKSLAHIQTWFERTLPQLDRSAVERGQMGELSLAVMTDQAGDPALLEIWAELAIAMVAAGATVLVPELDALMVNARSRERLCGGQAVRATLEYGQMPAHAGLHVVRTDTPEWSENLAGLGGCGAHLAVTLAGGHIRSGHPLIPVLQFAPEADRGVMLEGEVDGFVSASDRSDRLAEVKARLAATVSGHYVPASRRLGLSHFQLTRGLLGIST
ncbi:MAG: UxaA family hydrolase [Opitutaceae bacterium]|nr:UxaA family hydrolase [Opitutaceae bacterium]